MRKIQSNLAGVFRTLQTGDHGLRSADLFRQGRLRGIFLAQELERAAHDPITPAEVRQALSSIQGCFSDKVISSRDER
jgi:hypothetical protein